MFKNVIRTIVIALSVIIQVAFYYFVVNLVDYRPLVSLFAKALAIILALIIYRSNRNSSFKIAWLIFIFSVPICGLVFYIFFGHGTTLPIRKTKIISKYLEDKVEKGEDISVLDNDPTAKRLASMLKNTTGLPLYQGTQVTYFKSGEDTYPKLLEELEKAKKFIFIEFFIIARGGMWRSVCDILERKALSGVEVKVIYDDIGTAGRLKEKDVERLNKIPNFTIVPYNPMGYNFSLSLNYRDHRKIVVIDDVVAFTGGFNIGDEYIQQQKRFGYWRDTAIKLVGDAVYSFIVLFAQDWFICTKQIINTIDYSSIESSTNDGFVFPFGDGP
ncbi:MAG: PLDc N-terminal domain-containing protein, partial [Clostridia bacterium]